MSSTGPVSDQVGRVAESLSVTVIVPVALANVAPPAPLGSRPVGLTRNDSVCSNTRSAVIGTVIVCGVETPGWNVSVPDAAV